MLQLKQNLKPSACTPAFLADSEGWEQRLHAYMPAPEQGHGDALFRRAP